LTTKGMLHVPTTRVIVWNDIQRREAIHLHRVPNDRIVVTGAQPFDKWFQRHPSTGVHVFRRKVGLSTEQPFILFLGSTASISAPDAEVDFVHSWIKAIRESGDEHLQKVGILVRPHPYNNEAWCKADLSEFENAVVWPRHGANPVAEADRGSYYDSLVHAEAAIGINTSAMIEAAIVGTPVLTITGDEFAESQVGTLHFHYLLPENGGFVRRATSLDAHVSQLARVLKDPEEAREALVAFVSSFVRPHGLGTPCTPLVADAIEELPRCTPIRTRPGLVTRTLGRIGLRFWIRSSFKARKALRKAERDARKARRSNRPPKPTAGTADDAERTGSTTVGARRDSDPTTVDLRR
jgi:hypothetical protein